MSKCLAGALTISALLTCAVTASAQTKDTLPLTKVRLYETGVAYFERSGPLPRGTTGLPVPIGHVDDALKTLVILDADGKSTVSGITFPSLVTESLGRALAGLPSGEDASLSLPRLLQSLEGTAVEIRTVQSAVRGRIADVISAESSGVLRCIPGTETTDKGCTLRGESTVVVLTEAGELRRLIASDIVGVRPLDPATRARFDAALDAVTEGGTRSRRRFEVAASGGRRISLGYVAEAPVWRSTYRLVLTTDEKATVQGWALIHNDTDEAWQRVALELVNGQPDSFLFPLAAPRYVRRPLVTPNESLSSVPQLIDQTVDRMWGDDTDALGRMWGDEIGESFGAGGLGLSGIGEGGGGRGEGIGMGTIGTLGNGGGTGEAASSVVSVGSLASLAPADGLEAESLFEYSVATPLNLGPRSSAIVPFVSVTLAAERIAWFRSADSVARAAVRVTNGSHQTLPAGTIAVFADGGFAGESLLSRTKPQEERILRLGNDLDVELKQAQLTETVEPRSLELDAAGGEIRVHSLKQLRIEYELVNRSASGRMVYLDLDYQDNARVTGADRLGFDSERDLAQAVFAVDAHATRAPTLVVELGVMEVQPVASLDRSWLAAMTSEKTLPAGQRKVLGALLELDRRRAHFAALRRAARHELERREHDVARLRASVEALSGAKPKTLRRLVRRMDDLESEIVQLESRERSASKAIEKVAVEQARTLSRLPRVGESR